MEEKVCFCPGCMSEALPFGYNEEEESCIALKAALRDALTQLIAEGVTVFLTDLAGTGLYAAEELLHLQKLYPAVRLECLLPFEEQAAKWSEPLRDRYFYILEHCASVALFGTQYTDGCEEACRALAAERADVVLTVGVAMAALPKDKEVRTLSA